MRKAISLLAVFFVIIMLTACGGDDPQSVMKDSIKTMEVLITDMDKADSADDVVEVMEDFIDNIYHKRQKCRDIEIYYKFTKIVRQICISI